VKPYTQLAIFLRLDRKRKAINVPLIEALEAFSDARVDASTDGRFVVNCSVSGSTFSFGAPAEGELRISDLVSLSGLFIIEHAKATERLVSSGVATPTDAQVALEIVDALMPVSEWSSDFTGIRR
jgi:hypothetical protein